jgi:hypothetical protein
MSRQDCSTRKRSLHLYGDNLSLSKIKIAGNWDDWDGVSCYRLQERE